MRFMRLVASLMDNGTVGQVYHIRAGYMRRRPPVSVHVP